MQQEEKDKAREILKKRRLAAKGLKEGAGRQNRLIRWKPRKALTPATERLSPEDSEAREKGIAERALPAAAALRRSG